MQTKQEPREPVLLIALKIMLHAKLCLSEIIFLICVCWHPERICKALSSWGQRGQVRLTMSAWKNKQRYFPVKGCKWGGDKQLQASFLHCKLQSFQCHVDVWLCNGSLEFVLSTSCNMAVGKVVVESPHTCRLQMHLGVSQRARITSSACWTQHFIKFTMKGNQVQPYCWR